MSDNLSHNRPAGHFGQNDFAAPVIWPPMTDSAWTLGKAPIGRNEIILVLVVACIAKVVLILGFENAFAIKDHFTEYKMPASFYEQSWWQYFLPQKEVYGTWTPTTVVGAALLQQYVHPAIVLAFSHCALIIVGFYVALKTTRSMVFATTAALLFITVPFNYHVHTVHGTTAQGLLLSYFLLTVHASLLLLDRANFYRWCYLAISAFLFVFGYETWLDTFVVLSLLTPIIFVILKRNNRTELAYRVLKMWLIVTAVALTYILVKVAIGFGSGIGTETDLLLFYPSLAAMFDDFLVKVVSFCFTAVSLVLPSSMTGSQSLALHGSDWILAQQHGYHGPMQFLTYMNHVFLWRIHAGAYFVLLLGLGAWSAFRLYRGATGWQHWMLLICVVMLLFGAATHSLVKYRPMHSMPYLGYQVWVNVLGAIGIICVAIDALIARIKPARQQLVLVLCWSALVYTGFSVRAKLKLEAATMMMGDYPSLF